MLRKVPSAKAAKDARPSARMVRAAGLIEGGASIEAALEAAGYGAGAIAGLVPQYMGILAEAGLLGGATRGPGRPRKAAAAPAAPAPTTDTSGAQAPSQED